MGKCQNFNTKLGLNIKLENAAVSNNFGKAIEKWTKLFTVNPSDQAQFLLDKGDSL
jgi:predicted transcriptional regulator